MIPSRIGSERPDKASGRAARFIAQSSDFDGNILPISPTLVHLVGSHQETPYVSTPVALTVVDDSPNQRRKGLS
jgi:hypothetical protein